MPVHVDIRVNEKLITQLHIGRWVELKDNNQTSKYTVVSKLCEPHEVNYYAEGVDFTHKYSDGLEVCVEKALAALNAGNT